MSTLRSAIWRIAQSTTECSCVICTSCTGSGRIASPAAARQPSSSPPAQQQDASPGSRTPAQAAGRQPSSSPPAQQQPASPAAGRQPSSRTPAQQQDASPGSSPPAQAAGRQPGSRTPAPAAGRQPGSYVIYAPARAGAPAPRRSNVPARACTDAQVLRARPRAMRVRKRESLVGL